MASVPAPVVNVIEASVVGSVPPETITFTTGAGTDAILFQPL